MGNHNQEQHQGEVDIGDGFDILSQCGHQHLVIILQLGEDGERDLVDNRGECGRGDLFQFLCLIIVSQITGRKHFTNNQTLQIDIDCLDEIRKQHQSAEAEQSAQGGEAERQRGSPAAHFPKQKDTGESADECGGHKAPHTEVAKCHDNAHCRADRSCNQISNRQFLESQLLLELRCLNNGEGVNQQ